MCQGEVCILSQSLGQSRGHCSVHSRTVRRGKGCMFEEREEQPGIKGVSDACPKRGRSRQVKIQACAVKSSRRERNDLLSPGRQAAGTLDYSATRDDFL